MSQNGKKRERTISGPSTSGANRHGGRSLRGAITDAARAGVDRSGVTLEVDVPDEIVWSTRSESIASLVGVLVRGAVDDIGPTGEIIVTAWQTGDVLEIEVADNGPAMESRPQRLPMAAVAAGAELVWQNCPQGGMAVTAILKRAERLREAA